MIFNIEKKDDNTGFIIKNKLYDIDELIDEELESFEYQIFKRGREYYDDGNVVSVINADNRFIASVEGNDLYDVEIDIDLEGGFITKMCDCPYDFPCKHEVAVLFAIKNHKYEVVKLKEYVPKNDITISELIGTIPAEDIKKFLIDFSDDNFYLDGDDIREKFCSYLPIQSYEYYFNRIYNSIVLKKFSLTDYMELCKKMMNRPIYVEALNIIRALIGALHELNTMDILVDYFATIGMYLRIIYRKGDEDAKDLLLAWIGILEKNNYYDNVYLEDAVLSIK
jgi:zinc finger SWIM domain protein